MRVLLVPWTKSIEQQRAHQARYRINSNCHPDSGITDLNQKASGHNENNGRINIPSWLGANQTFQVHLGSYNSDPEIIYIRGLITQYEWIG